VNLLRNQLDAGDAADEGGKTLRPMRGAVEPDALALLQIALPERRPLSFWLGRKFVPGPPLPVGQRLALLLQRGAAVLLFALQRLALIPYAGLPAPPAARWCEQLHRGAMAGGQRPRLVHARQGVLRKLLPEEFPHLLDPDFFVLDQLRQAVHVAVEIDKDVIAGAGGEDVTHVLQRPDEGARRVALLPRRRHLRDVLFLAEAALVLLVLLVERKLPVLLRPLLSLVAVITVRQGEPMVAGELPRDHHQLVVVEGHVTGLAALGVDARPDDMAVLARDAILVLLYMEDDRARLAGQPEAVLGAVDIIEILLR
jgi:hypothetical protein